MIALCVSKYKRHEPYLGFLKAYSPETLKESLTNFFKVQGPKATILEMIETGNQVIVRREITGVNYEVEIFQFGDGLITENCM